jgi:hypothetical protein
MTLFYAILVGAVTVGAEGDLLGQKKKGTMNRAPTLVTIES